MICPNKHRKPSIHPECEYCTPHEAQDGEWIQPVMKNYQMECCDCGLTHRMDFRIADGKIEFRVYRLDK